MFICLLTTLAATAGGIVDRLAAVVDDDPVTLSEVYDAGGDYIRQNCIGTPSPDRCAVDLELEVLDTLIKWSLIRRELDNLGMRVTGEEVDRTIDMVIRENGFADRQELRAYIEEEGTRWENYRDQLKDRLRADRFRGAVLAPRVTVNEDELRDLYQRSQRFTVEEEVRLEVFGVQIPVEADATQRQTIVDETTEVVAGLRSGDLRWVDAAIEHDSAELRDVVGSRAYSRGQLAEPIDAVAFSAEIGVVNDPVEIGNVLFVIRVVERTDPDSARQPFEAVAPQLQNQLFEQKLIEAEEEWYQRARRETAVTILLD